MMSKALFSGLLIAGVVLAGMIGFGLKAVAGAKADIDLSTYEDGKKGLKYQDIKVGTGTEATKGDKATVHYTGTLMSGKKFDSSLDRGQPFSFTIGKHRVIQGWEEGVQGMREGGKRTLIIPPAMAYGANGVPGAIPANATLKFDIELLKVNQ